MLFANTSTVYAQKISLPNNKVFTNYLDSIKRINNSNYFVIDSLGLKEFSSLIKEKKSLPSLYKGFQKRISEKDNEIKLLNIKIEEYLKNSKRFDQAMKTKDQNIWLNEKIYQAEIKKIKSERNKAYIIGGGSIVFAVLILIVN